MISVIFFVSNVSLKAAEEVGEKQLVLYDVDIYDADSLEKRNCSLIGTNEYKAPNSLDDIGRISVKQILSINNIGISLYPVFEDKDMALENIRIACPNIISELSKSYDLPKFSEENCVDYRNKMREHLDNPQKPDWYDKNNCEFAKLDMFFDIYENDDKNAKIIKMVKSVDSISLLMKNLEFRLALSWKDGDKFCEKLIEMEGKTIKDFDVHIDSRFYSTDYAVDYAKKYAKTPNPSYKYISNADCTNFTSQIMCYAGKTVNATWGAVNVSGVWKYTSAWANANAFARYWGVDYTYFAHNPFANKLQKGDYITEDKLNDGDWDHMAFVVSIGSMTSSGYRDYQVAQHTDNYLAWASSSTCGWDTLENKYPYTVFGIVRV